MHMNQKPTPNLEMRIANYKIKASKELLTSQAGAILFGEFLERIGFYSSLSSYMPLPGNHRGYEAKLYISSLIMMLHIGGKHIEDLRLVDRDKAMKRMLRLKVPSTSATGDWLYKIGRGIGIDGLRKVNNDILRLSLNEIEDKDLTLDIDATGIEANKYNAKWTYKDFKGYMPMVGHIAENGMVIYDEFREGNVSPCTDNYQFMMKCIDQLPKNKRIAYFRADAASYQKEIVEYCDVNNIYYTIGGKMCTTLRREIEIIPDDLWIKEVDRHGIKTGREITSLKRNITGYKGDILLVISRTKLENRNLFENSKYHYHIVATNMFKKDIQDILHFYQLRGEYSENSIKELKMGFNASYMPSGKLEANAAYFRIQAIAYNLSILFRQIMLEDSQYKKSKIATIRLYIYQIPGKLIKTGRNLFLSVPKHYYHLLQNIRAKILLLSPYP